MPVRLTVDIPESAFSLFRHDATHFVREMRIAAAVKWFEMGVAPILPLLSDVL